MGRHTIDKSRKCALGDVDDECGKLRRLADKGATEVGFVKRKDVT